MGQPILLGGNASPQDTHDLSTVQHHEIGEPGYLPDGRVWHYCKHTLSTTLTRGELMVGAEIDGQHHNMGTTTGALVVGSTRVTGITLGSTALTANEYADGYLMVVDGAGEGTYYKIRTHDAGTATSADFTLELYDPIQVASDANTEVSLIEAKYANLQQSNTDNADVVIGVPNVTVTAGDTTPQYFWVQTQGFCPAFVVGTPAVGTNLMVSDGTAGMMEARLETDLDATIAYMVSVGITGEVQVVDLAISGL